MSMSHFMMSMDHFLWCQWVIFYGVNESILCVNRSCFHVNGVIFMCQCINFYHFLTQKSINWSKFYRLSINFSWILLKFYVMHSKFIILCHKKFINSMLSKNHQKLMFWGGSKNSILGVLGGGLFGPDFPRKRDCQSLYLFFCPNVVAPKNIGKCPKMSVTG